MQVRKQVAVVEHDPVVRSAILPILDNAGYEAKGFDSALAFYRALVSTRFDVALLGDDVPDEDGFAIARHLRACAGGTRLVILGSQTIEPDRLQEVAVDGFLIKPVDPSRLLATLSALTVTTMTGRWRLDAPGWRLVSPGGTEIPLSLPEQQVLRLLAATPGQPVRRERLIAGLSADTHAFDPHRLEVLVYRLRRKCESAAGAALPLRSVRGIGYTILW